MLDEHLCCTCPVLRPTQDPRVYERANCCEGCRARLRSLPADLLDAYVHLELERTGSVGAKVSGSRTPPLPLVVDALDLTLANHGTVEDDLVPLYERIEVEVAVWDRALPKHCDCGQCIKVRRERQQAGLPDNTPPSAERYTISKLRMSRRRRARDANGWLAYGLSGDQTGHLGVLSVLDWWARDWQSYLPTWQLLPEVTVSALVSWFVARIDWACSTHPAIDDFASELDGLLAAVRSVAGLTKPRPELKWGVPCRECEKVTLYRWPGSDYVECGSCPALISPDEYHRWTSLIAEPEWRDWVETVVAPQRAIA